MGARCALAVILGAISILPAHAQSSGAGASPDPLSIEARIVAQKKCFSPTDEGSEGRPPVVFITLTVDLRARNVSARNVILCKKCIVDGGPRVRAVRPDGRPGETTADIQKDSFGFEPPPPFHGQSNADYVVLKPGDTYEAHVPTNIFGAVASNYPPRLGQLSAGKYFLEGGFFSWSEPNSITNSFKQHWKRIGDLYDRGFETAPMPFEIDLPKDLPKCPD
jgi:hypothetical protein